MNICRLILKDMPDRSILDTNQVRRYGCNPLVEISEDSPYKFYGNFFLYTGSLSDTYNELKKTNPNIGRVLCQDLDGFGERMMVLQ
jgi:hypothetical protein